MSLYQIQPDEGFTPEELAQSEVATIYASIAVVTFIATIGVVLRFVSRARSKSTIGYDDYTIALALVNIPALICAWSMPDITIRYS